MEPVAFNRGCYSVDMRFFYRVTISAFCSSSRAMEVEGLCVFDKRVILFGGEGSAKVFSSRVRLDALDQQLIEQSNMPIAVVEAVDPIVLGAKLVDCCDCRCCDCDLCEIPTCVCQCFSCDLTPGDDYRRVFVTLGQFSIIRLERDSQLLMPVYDYCLPDKSCTCGSTGCSCDDPCEMFQNICFPVDQFFPPKAPCDNPCDGGRQQCCRK